jgi:NAD(P)-dependent dehydrogenase (short-subunit alcohol dehydrogenase family)
MFDSKLLIDKKILVTGGGSGLGASMARRFAELGASLVLCGRRESLLQETARSIAADTGALVSVLVCDIRDAQAVEHMFDDIWRVSPLSVLVNNAAATFVAQTEHLSARAADAILAPTLHGGLYCSLAAGKRWIADLSAGAAGTDNATAAAAGASLADVAGVAPLAPSKMRGTILSILSTSTLTGRAFTVPSAMAKSAMLAMTKSLAVEWGPKGVRCVAIAPGPFPTPGAEAQLRFQSRAAQGMGGPTEFNPLRRVGEHIELANLAAYLVSDHAAYINGEMVAIDGGAHLRTSGAEDLLRLPEDQWQLLREARTKR